MTTYFTATNGNDFNPGNQSLPFRTIAKGLSVLVPNDTLYIRGGTYDERINSDTQTVHNGTVNNPITIASFPSEFAILMPSSGSNTIALHAYNQLQDIQYITFDRLTLDGTNTLDTIDFSGQENGSAPTIHHIRFLNGEIRNSKTVASPGTQTSGNNIHMEGHNIEFYNTHIHHSGSGYGIYFIGHDNIIDTCEINNNYGFGIQIYSNPRPPGTVNNIIRNCNIHDNGVLGNVFASNAITVNHVDGTQIYNNLIYNHGYGGMNIGYGNPDNTQIYNNVFYNNGNFSGGEVALALGDGSTTTPTNTKIQNNIFWNNRGGSNTIITYSANNTTQSNNNFSDPVFVNQGTDFHILSNSPARDSGITLGLFSTDKDGITRPQGPTWDVGAYEFITGVVPGSATYYVSLLGNDTNAGTSVNNAKRTINAALALLTTGDTLYIRTGVYNENIGYPNIDLPSGIDFNTPVTIAGYPGDSPPTVFGIHINGTNHHIIFGNFILDPSVYVNGTPFSIINGAGIPGDNYIRLTNTEIRHWTLDTDNGAFIQSNYNELINVTAHDGLSTGSGNGVFIAGSNNTINKSSFYNIAQYGVIIYNNSFATHDNIISNSRVYNSGGGLFISKGINNTVFNNLIYNNSGYGIAVFYVANGSKIYNNTVFKNTASGFIADAGINNIELINNILYQNVPNIDNSSTGLINTANIITNPLFINEVTFDLRILPGSPAIGIGQTLAIVPIDYLNNTRTIPYDSGAYKFISIVPGDNPFFNNVMNTALMKSIMDF